MFWFLDAYVLRKEPCTGRTHGSVGGRELRLPLDPMFLAYAKTGTLSDARWGTLLDEAAIAEKNQDFTVLLSLEQVAIQKNISHN